MDQGWKAALVSVALAGGYWAARQAVNARHPIFETRELAAEEVARLTQSRVATGELPRRLDGWLVETQFIGEVRRPDGTTEPVERLTGLSRMRQDWWVRRDLQVSLLRLAGLAGCLLAAWRLGGLRDWGWTAGFNWNGAVPVALAGASFILPVLKETGEPMYGEIPATVMWALNAPVGFWEEACFRSLMFLGLSRQLGARKAALLSSLVFAVWHYGMQPVIGWPRIFLAGVVWCGALHAGVGVPWLALEHWAVDALVLRLGRIEAPLFDLPSFALLLFAAAWGFRLLGKPAAEPSSPPPN